jgi:serine/threonine-protein kinase
MRAVKKAAALLPLCTTLSCSGPTAELRPPPVTAEPCPPGALKAMEQLGINIGDDATSGLLPMGGGQMIKPPKEGRATLKIIKSLGKLGYGTTVAGRLIVGEKRVWGHFVQATTPQGETYPVCLEVRQELTDDGEMESTLYPEAVKEFE